MPLFGGLALYLSTSRNDLGAEFKWSIENFWSLSHGYLYISPTTFIDGKYWWLEIYPNGCSGRDSLGYVDILLCRESSSKPVSVNLSISLITVNREKSNEQHATKVFEGIPRASHAFNRVISRSELRDRRSELMPSGILTVAVTLKWTAPTGSKNKGRIAPISRPFSAESIQSSPNVSRSPPLKRSKRSKPSYELAINTSAKAGNIPTNLNQANNDISSENCSLSSSALNGMSSAGGPQKSKALQDYKRMLLKQENCDVVLKVGEREFPAHKNILAARCPVLASSFQHNMKESKTETVDIEHCDSSSFSDFLCYLYCEDASSLSQENVFSLFKTTDKFDIPDLKMKCLEFIKENLSVESFCKTITLALLHTETELINAASEFFVKNAENIVETAEWQTFNAENPSQGNELFVKFIKSSRCVKL